MARHVAICPPMDTCLSLIEEAMKQEECSQPIPHLPCSPAKGNPGGSKAWQEKLDCAGAEEKHNIMSSLGLVRTDLIPRIQALMEWRRRRRRRRQRQCKRGSSSAEHPSNAVTVSLPICNPANTCLNKKPENIISSEESTLILKNKVRKKQEKIPARVPQSDRSTRGKCVKADMTTASIERQCVKSGDRVTAPSKRTAKTVEVAHNKRSLSAKAKLSKSSMQRLDKAKLRNKGSQEMRGVVNTPPSMDQEKHKRNKARPLKLLDSDFVFGSLQPAGEAKTVKTKEKRVGGCLTPSASQAGELTPCRVLRARGPPIIPLVTRSNQKRHHMTKSSGPEATNARLKVKVKERAGMKILLILYYDCLIVMYSDLFAAN